MSFELAKLKVKSFRTFFSKRRKKRERERKRENV